VETQIDKQDCLLSPFIAEPKKMQIKIDGVKHHFT